jgi:pimeloyl-ACP methyl ester carboxylesterase
VSSAASYPDLELPYANTARTVTGESLVKINGKSLYYKSLGPKEGPHVVFVHGLGGSQEFYKPLISALGLDQTHRLHLVDLEGHGLSPTSSLSNVSIESYAEDIRGVFDLAGINESSGATVIAHSMGCHIALTLTRLHGSCVKNLILIGPPPSPLPQPAVSVFTNRAATVRREGMTAVVDAVADAGVSSVTKSNNAVAVASVRLSLLGTDPEGYAKGCAALAGGKAIGLRAISARTLIITGDEDKVSPSNICDQYSKAIPKSEHPVVLQGVGHWHVFEDVKGTGAAIRRFL